MRQRFSDLMWVKVVRIPVVVFWAVALADGRADSGEQSCYLEYVSRTTHADPLLRLVCDVLAEQGKDALQLSAREKDFKTYLPEMKGILESALSPQERRSFLAGLLCLGHHVAGATGGFFGLGNRVAPVEAARLEEVSAILGLPELLDQA